MKKPLFVKLVLIVMMVILFSVPYSPLLADTSDVKLNNPLTGKPGDITGGVPALIGQVINAVLGIVGSLALLMFVYGGLLWMTAGGKDERVTQGKNVLIWATLGMVVIFASYAIVKLLFQSLTSG